MTTTDIVTRQHDQLPANLDQQMRYADTLAQAGLVPDSFRKQPANVLIAMEIARTLDESPWTVMAEMAVIGGKPSFSAKFMRSRVRQAGHRLRESYDGDTGAARCVIIRHDDPDFEHVATWDEAKARQHGYWGKGHWQKNPQLMLQNRALSECVREACYEVMAGIGYTPDEVADFTPQRPVQQSIRPRTERPMTAQQIMQQHDQQQPDSVSHEAVNLLWRRVCDAHPGIDQASRMAWISAEIDRDITRLRDLTEDDIAVVGAALAALDAAVDAEIVDPATGEVEVR